MKLKPIKQFTSFILGLMLFILTDLHAQSTQPDNRIQVREGYELSIVQSDLKSPRFMEFGPDGTLYVSFPREGEILALKDGDGDGYYETKNIFVKGHKTVHGMYWHEGWLWFTESGAIFKAKDDNQDGVADKTVTVIEEGKLPKGGGHWWRPVVINNERLYTAIGCSGNITDETDTERLKIWSFDLNGGDKKLFATGLRNTEKLVIRPGTNEIWGMDHGSDWFGGIMEKKEDQKNSQPITDLNPPGEMNHYVKGAFYGHPYITGNRLPRYEYMERDDIVELASKTTPPAWASGAHWAPNAMEFYTGDQFPDEAHGDAFVAYHGSWNRSNKDGYCVTRVFFDNGKPYGELVYVDFLTESGDVLGRPVDIVVAPDGSILISDDHGSNIYKLTYTGGKKS